LKPTRIIAIVRRSGPIVTIGLFGIAMLVIHHELKLHPWRDIVAAVHATAWSKIGAAAGLTAIGFVTLIGYDWLGFKYVHYNLLKRKIAFSGFIGYAFSQSLGQSLVSGGSVRLRLYSSWGVPLGDISRIFFFGWMTFYLGLIALGGFLFTVEAQHAAPFLHVPVDIIRAIGIVMLVLLASYLAFSLRRKRPLRVRSIEFRVPRFRVSLLQVLLASMDLTIAGSVLYVLLPDGSPVSFPAFLTVYLIAVVAGATSQLPGGIGVLEGVMLTLLTPELSQASVFGALLVYRVVYTLGPLVLAACMLAGYELLEQKIPWVQTSRTLGRTTSWLIPNALAMITFIAGVILLFSGATPDIQSRMEWIEFFLPLSIVEGAHFLASIAGLVLIILARGLQLRLDAAYWLTLIVLAVGIVLSIIKGGDYEEAIALSIMLAAVAPCHARFNRQSSVLHERFTPGWIVTILATIGLTAWLFFFAYKHVEYSNDLWWKFTDMDNAPRSMRALVGVAVFAIVFVGLRMTKTATPRSTKPDAQALAKAQTLAAACRRPTHTFPCSETRIFCSAPRKMRSSCTPIKGAVPSRWAIRSATPRRLMSWLGTFEIGAISIVDGRSFIRSARTISTSILILVCALSRSARKGVSSCPSSRSRDPNEARSAKPYAISRPNRVRGKLSIQTESWGSCPS